ncbi:MAG: hypothetical protein HUU57_09895 [Bdellovibrio sp.]|nr:hypothetical protein [Bdellovibrio sp.]
MSSRNPAQALQWLAATEGQVANAVCRQKLPITTEEIFRYYKNLPAEPGLENGTNEVLGIPLVNERPRLILALAKLLTPADQTKLKSLPQNFKDTFKIASSCKSALCASQKIFGVNVGPQMILLMDLFDVNTSPYSYENADTFTASEISDAVKTFELLAPEQKPFTKSNQQLSKFKRGQPVDFYDPSEGEVLANASIHLFDGWSTQSSEARQYALYHEFAHNMARSYFASTQTSSAWLQLSQWKKVREKNSDDKIVEKFRSSLASDMGHPFVSMYSKENPAEDFAESVTAYRLNPQHLKKTAPDKYKIIRHVVLNGREFTSPKNCNQVTATQQYQKEIDRAKNIFTEKEKSELLKTCRLTFDQTILGNVPVSFFDDCINFQATLLWYGKNHQTYPGLLQQGLFDNDLRLSQLKFAATRKELAPILAADLAKWISQQVSHLSPALREAKTKDEYCSIWSQLSNSSYNQIDFSTEWMMRSFDRDIQIRPLKGASRGLCLDLVHDISPAQKTSTLKYYKDQLKKFLFLTDPEEAPENDQGLNEETIKKYILEKVGV